MGRQGAPEEGCHGDDRAREEDRRVGRQQSGCVHAGGGVHARRGCVKERWRECDEDRDRQRDQSESARVFEPGVRGNEPSRQLRFKRDRGKRHTDVLHQVRTMGSPLEHKYGIGWPADHVEYGWLFEYIAFLIDRAEVGKKGMNPYERGKGKGGMMPGFDGVRRMRFVGKGFLWGDHWEIVVRVESGGTHLAVKGSHDRRTSDRDEGRACGGRERRDGDLEWKGGAPPL